MDGFKKWHQPSRAVCTPISATKSAPTGHGAMSDLSPLSGEERKSNFGAVKSVDDPTRTFGLKEYASISGPESVLPLLIALILAEVGRLSVLHPPDVDLRKRRGKPASFCIHGDQDDNEIIFSQHIVHINAKRASGNKVGAD